MSGRPPPLPREPLVNYGDDRPAGLTGRVRHRRSFLGRMVLQVETAYHQAGYGRPQPGRRYAATEWRDATFDDMADLESMQADAPQALG